MSNTTEFERLMLELMRELKSDMHQRFELVETSVRELKTDMRQRFEQVDKRFEQVDKRFEQVDKQFEQVGKRFEQIDKRFDQVDERLHELKEELREVKHDTRADRDKLQQVYESRDKVKIIFGWQWGMVSLFIAVIAAGISRVFA